MRSIRHYLTIGTTKTLLCAFLLSKLNHCNSLFQILQNVFLTNPKRSKVLQPDLSSKLAGMNTSNPSFINFTGYQQSPKSSIKSQLSATVLSLKVTQSVFLNSWLSTIHPDNIAPFLEPKPSACLSRKQRPFDNELFFTGPTQWNSLPYDVRHSASISSLKQD